MTEVHQFDNVQDVYVANDRLYILDRSSNITIYNLLTQQEEKKLQYGDHASSIGADSKGRIYLAESNGNGDDYDLYLLSPEGTLLSQALSEEAVYGFCGFDESNGNYYVDTYNMKAISLVLSDTYGPNDTRKKFLNLVLDALKSQDLNFKMSLGEQEICYIYIEDVVNAYLKSRDLISSQGIKELKTYSVFGNEILTLNNLVELLEKIFNKKLSTEKGYYPYRLREIMKFNYAHIERLPNWEPKISLKEGVKRI